MFNQAKYVECYLTSDLEKEFDLTRQKLIGIAHLLGSDYTEGLPGVGPVTALEILSEFPSLNDFKQWFEGVQMNTIPKSADAGNPFKKKFRRQASKLFLPPSFPDPRVDVAYMKPEVDDDPSPFQWGVPNLDALRSFLMATIGWSAERTDEVLVPVIKDMNRRMDEGTQSNITAFFEGGIGAGAYAPRQKVAQGSKRMGTALERMAQKAKRKRNGGNTEDAETADTADPTEAAEAEAEDEVERTPATRKKRAKRGGKRAGAATGDD
jgi:DNA excision repair protein ERCC-5